MIAWFDCETTGLEPTHDVLLEVGVIITDDNLNEVANRSAVISQRFDQPAFEQMPDIVHEMHTVNGLLDDVARSTFLLLDVEHWMIEFMRAEQFNGDKPVMGGNSLTHDRRFLAQYMPKLHDTFHYRNIDVSGIREVARRRRPDLTELEPRTGKNHRVLDDCRASIALLDFYDNLFFRTETS